MNNTSQRLKEKFVDLLFAVLFVLQAADLHSTLAGIHQQGRYENNKVILFLANYVPFEIAVISIKLLVIGVIGMMAFAWKKSEKVQVMEFTVVLSITSVFLLSVVLNNYS